MAKYKRVMGCGCVIGLDYDDTLAIHYCAKHKAAPDMYETLLAVRWELREHPIRKRIDKALAKAEG